MNRLTVLYDASCGLCANCRHWLESQNQVIPLEFLDLASPALDRRYPGLRRLQPDKQMIVVSDAGEIWQGEAAWLLCLHALLYYQTWAARLAHPALRPLARALYRVVSRHRQPLSQLLRLTSAEHCPTGACPR